MNPKCCIEGCEKIGRKKVWCEGEVIEHMCGAHGELLDRFFRETINDSPVAWMCVDKKERLSWHKSLEVHEDMIGENDG